MKKQNTSGFSIIIAILLVVVMTLLVLYILEYMIPYSKNVKGIENSSNAFYQTESGIEGGLFHLKMRGDNITTESGQTMPGTPVGFDFGTTSSGSNIPALIDGEQEGNSSYSGTYNTISIGNPIQLQVGNNTVDWENTTFDFQVPKIGGNNYTLSGGTTAIINWQLSAQNDTLNATGSWINSNNINGGNFYMNLFQGQNLAGDENGTEKISNGGTGFYKTKCKSGSGCILKLSVINKLETTTGVKLPYLEYKIDFGTKILPLRFSRIKAKGKSYGFQKSLEERVPQQTTNEAFDFTVFQ